MDLARAPAPSSPRLSLMRIAGIVLVALATSAAHYLTPPEHIFLHNVYQRLYYIPILLACAWFGLIGGLVTAGFCAALYAPHILLQWSHLKAYQASQVMELGVFVMIGFLAGLLSDRERLLRRRAEAIAAERDRVLAELEGTLEKMRRADRLATLGAIAAGLAHEIRNPLGAIGGAVEILETEFPSGHPRREFIDILQQEIQRLNRVTGKYLDYARPHAPHSRPTNVNAVVVSAVDLLRRSAARASVDLLCRPAEGIPDAMTDPAQLHQAIVNLVLNGVQAMASGGVLEVATSTEPGAVFVSIRDHGPGLPDGGADQLFQPFYSTKESGTGLGLAIARQIVEACKGHLTADNAPGGGAIFRIQLPAVADGESGSQTR